MFNTLKSVLDPTPEQKKVATDAAKTCKSAAFIMGKRIFRVVRKIVSKLLAKVHMERFATPVTIYLLLCLGAYLLRCIPGFQEFAMAAFGILGHVIAYAIMAFVVYKLFRFARRCYAEAKEEMANQSQEPSEVSDDTGKN